MFFFVPCCRYGIRNGPKPKICDRYELTEKINMQNMYIFEMRALASQINEE